MSEPLPPDPYAALGLAKDVDTATVKKTHRKLVLTHHPDRIQDPALKERGKDEFQKIQQAYEILVDPVRRSRYDDQLKLDQLRKETMAFREPPRTQTYPMRPAPHSASNSREWDSDDRRFYEVRQPRNSDYSSNENFEEFNRSSSRKNPEYPRPSSSRKTSESQRPDRTAKAAWGVAYAAVNVGIKIKKEAEKTRNKVHETKQEIRDRDMRKARKEKEERTKQPFVVSEDSDSDTATRVTSSTIRPSKPSSRYSREPDSASRRSSGATRVQQLSGSDSDAGTYVSTNKWESHHDKSKAYIAAATAGGKRPPVLRQESASYWNSPKRSGSDSDRRPTSSRGRDSYEETPTRPSMPTHTSSPANLRSKVDGGKTKERRTATGSYPSRDRERNAFFDTDHRKEMPSFSRSQTMPTPPMSSSKKDSSMPSKSSNLKHAETHDSGYGTSSSAHTPEMRGDSPSRRQPQSSKKYQVVEPQESDEDRQTRIRVLDDDSDHRRRRYTQSPEADRREDRRREKSDRPSMGSRSKTHRDRDGAAEPPRMRRADTSSKFDARSPRESPRESPSVSRHNSAREKLPYEVSDGEKDPSRYRYPSSEKINMRPAYNEPKHSSYGRESSDRRSSHEYTPSSRFQDDSRRGDTHSRRPSVQAY